MSTSKRDDLHLITLPLGENDQPKDFLVMVADQGSQYVRVIFSDVERTIVDESIAGSDLPAYYSPKKREKLSALLAVHQEQLQELLLTGAIKHGNLTIARAIYCLKKNPSFSYEEALEMAINDSIVISNWHRNIEKAVKEFAASSF